LRTPQDAAARWSDYDRSEVIDAKERQVSEQSATAAALLIGNEILSGRTRDANLAYLGQQLADLGIPLCEARVVADEETEIIATVRALSARYTYVFATGGIGPTHDDITTAAIARAFERPLEVNSAAEAKLKQYYRVDELSAPRLKMAMVPAGSTLIDNPVSSAPGFCIENVFVLAGVPSIMQTMFDALKHQLRGGAPILSRSVTAPIGESRIAEGLAAIQRRYAGLKIGSYPFAELGRVVTSIVLRGTDAEHLQRAADEVVALMKDSGVPATEIARR
jgi:molybdenum cofactor synthesis domain-containing protein